LETLIFGSKDFAETVAELADACGRRVAGFVDDFNKGAHILGTFDEIVKTHPPTRYEMVMAIGYSNLGARWSAWQKVKRAGYASEALIHPKAYVAPTAVVDEGAMVMANAVADVRSRISPLCVVWPSSCINHDSVIGSNTFLSPGAIICGNATVGSHCFIGAGAAIVDRANVPDGTYIKMLERYSRR
jgi:sugar O-acyltransferase (sialic acid O-acetyltransferase NeuD family)